MKNYKHLLRAAYLLICLLSSTLISAQDVTVTVTVDTDGIWNDVNQIKNYVKLSDGTSTADFGGNHKNFETTLGVSKEIEWIGVANNAASTDVIAIEHIIMKRDVSGNTKLLEKESYDNPGNGRVRGKAISVPTPNKKHHYYIQFSITRGGEKKNFVIDPKIRLGGT